jgi:L-fuculose-phosphate aldolase
VLVTPRGVRKDGLDTDGIVTIDPTHPDPDAVARATTEWPLHRACYEAGDVGAVVHTHAPGLTALGLGEGDGHTRLAGSLPEAAAAVGGVATVAHRPSGSEALARAAAAAVGEGAGVLLLERHGAVSVGADLAEALDRMELAELAARAVALAG